MLNEKNIQNYLKIISVIQPEVSVSFLKELQNAHLGAFPFNNLGVLLHENLSLESQALFDRLVTQRRGGYCFEQNKILFEVLSQLGFQCDITLCRVLHNRNFDVPRTHRITKVTLADKNYIVDVGFGPLCPREPLLLDTDKPQDQGDAVYRIIQPDMGHYLIQKREVGGWFTLYSFDNGFYTEADCICGHHYSSTHPDAAFVNNLVVSLKSYDNVRLLRNGEFHFIKGGKTEITEISSEDRLGAILFQDFGLTVTSGQLSTLYEGYCK
ncbi:MAG: arylamine N-acetyltransferase [Proteobacteria bacterium]|nr:arylamine N-acetyltransferase [Pseudomonadota bacterium]